MTVNIVVAYVHLLALGLGFYSIWTRANALKKVTHYTDLPEVFKADNIWGIAALLWIVTGLWRAFGGLEKGTGYYLHSTAFIVKMILFSLVFLLELKPMIALVSWRIKIKKQQTVDISRVRLFATLSHLQLGLLTIIVFLAVLMARGV